MRNQFNVIIFVSQWCFMSLLIKEPCCSVACWFNLCLVLGKWRPYMWFVCSVVQWNTAHNFTSVVSITIKCSRWPLLLCYCFLADKVYRSVTDFDNLQEQKWNQPREAVPYNVGTRKQKDIVCILPGVTVS